MDVKKFAAEVEARRFPMTWPGQWVNNAWLPPRAAKGAVTKSSVNPNTGEKLMEVPADKETVGAAVESAYKARNQLALTPLHQRLEWIGRFRASLTDYQTLAERVQRIEAGKPLWEAQSDFDCAVRYLDWVASHGETILDSLLAPARLGPVAGAFAILPIGVTAAYLPFSTPLTTFAFYFSAAMLAGCPLVLNSSSHAYLSSMLFAMIAQESAMPPGALNVVFGNFNSFKQILADKRVAAILYTGSREHCDTIRVESRTHLGRQVVLQSGGKNAVVVHESADLTHAVRCVVYGALKSAGQRCTSTSRVFVARSVAAQFAEQLSEAFKKLKIGRTDVDHASPADEPFMGPLYSEKAVEKFLRFQTMANRESDKTLLWGKAVESIPTGNFVQPGLHYLAKFDNNAAYQGNVLFSPDVAIYDYDVLENAIEQINTTDAAFAVSFLGDPAEIESRRQLFLAPNLLVNQPTVETDDATLPLAGRLQSGHHRYHGPGIALYLCYPQVLTQSDRAVAIVKAWPWG